VCSVADAHGGSKPDALTCSGMPKIQGKLCDNVVVTKTKAKKLQWNHATGGNPAARVMGSRRGGELSVNHRGGSSGAGRRALLYKADNCRDTKKTPADLLARRNQDNRKKNWWIKEKRIYSDRSDDKGLRQEIQGGEGRLGSSGRIKGRSSSRRKDLKTGVAPSQDHRKVASMIQ